MFKRVLDTTVRATMTLFLRDFFENVSSQNFEDLRVGSSIHVALRNLAIKQSLADELLKNAPLRLLHGGLDRLQAELTLNTKQARKLLLQEVLIVLEFDPDWVPPPPAPDAPPSMPSGISGAAAIVYSSDGGETLEDSFLRDDMKNLLSTRNLNEEEAIKMPDDVVDQSASAVAALLKELVHHSEVAIDGFTVRIRFPPSKRAAGAPNPSSPSHNNNKTNELLLRFPSIFIRDKTVFDGRPSDQFSKFVSIAPPIIQVYALSEEEAEQPVSKDRDLAYEDTLAMGYGFLHASAEMGRAREAAFAADAAASSSGKSQKKEGGGSSDTANSSSSSSPTVANGGMDFHSIMESQRCVTIEVIRRSFQPRVPVWDVRIAATPFLLCLRPHQVGLLLDIGHRVGAQAELQAEVVAQREEAADAAAAGAESEQQQQQPPSFGGGGRQHQDPTSQMMDGKTTGSSQQSGGKKERPATFSISAKCQHGVIALFTSDDDVEPFRSCWESIEDFGCFVEDPSLPSASASSSSQQQLPDGGTDFILPKCLSRQHGFFALSAGSGKLLLEKNTAKNKHGLDAFPLVGDSDIDLFLDRYTETTFSASLGSLVVVDSSVEVGAVKLVELGNERLSSGQPAAEFIARITQAVPFHDVLSSHSSCVNLSGVRHRHPTTNEAFSRALLRSTVTVKDFRLDAPGQAALRLEPTMLARVVKCANYMTEVVKTARDRNKVSKTVSAKTTASPPNDAERQAKTTTTSTSLSQQHMDEAFEDDATTFTMNFNQVDIQCLLLKQRMPAPDIWGALTCRFFDHLSDEGPAEMALRLLPRSMVVRASGTRFVATPGTEPVNVELAIGSAEAIIRHDYYQKEEETSSSVGGEARANFEAGDDDEITTTTTTEQQGRPSSPCSYKVTSESRTLFRIAPSDRLRALTLAVAVKSVPFSVDDLTKLDLIAKQLAQLPSSDHEPLRKTQLAEQLSSVSCDIQIPKVVGVGDFLMDDLIFILYAATEMSEISVPLASYVPLDETAASVAAKAFVPNNVTAVNLRLQEVQCFIGAPRLDRHGVFLGEPLSSLLPPDQAPRNLKFAIHRYEVKASQLSLTLGIGATTSPLTQHWGMFLGLGSLSLKEHLIQLDGQPGAVRILCDSFAEAHRRSYEGAADERRGRSGRVLNLTLIRDTCLRKRSDLMQIGIDVECVSIVQHASYDGDAWPQVLSMWAGDAPTHVKAGERVHARGSVQQEDVIPLAAAITLNAKARDLLLDWKPEQRTERLAVLLSGIECDIPELVTGDPKLTVTVRIREQASLLLHNNFPTPIIEFDRAMFVSGINIFGSTRKGALEDLQFLGFAQLCTIGPRKQYLKEHSAKSIPPTMTGISEHHAASSSSAAAAPPTIVIRKSHPSSSRKLQVEVHHFFTEFSFAPDSCTIFRQVIEHVQDKMYTRKYVVSPVRLVRRAGGAYSRVRHSVVPIEAPVARAFVQDFDLIDDVNSIARHGGRSGGAANNDDSGSAAAAAAGIPENVSAEWDVPDLDDHGREKPNAFTMNPGFEEQQDLSTLMSDLYYFQPPIFDESAVAEPLFNVPNSIDFELLLHSCDFKLSFFTGADFAMLKEDEDGSFHSMAHNTVAVFDIQEHRQRMRLSRNSSECVAVWIMNCFAQLDSFPNEDEDALADREENLMLVEEGIGGGGGNDQEGTGASPTTTTATSSRSSGDPNKWAPIRQLIFRAGDFELEDLVQESPVRKMVHCALPKSQRDAPVITVRLRTLEQTAPDPIDAAAARSMNQPPPPKLQSQQLSVRLLPLGVNVSARTVMRVVATFINNDDGTAAGAATAGFGSAAAATASGGGNNNINTAAGPGLNLPSSSISLHQGSAAGEGLSPSYGSRASTSSVCNVEDFYPDFHKHNPNYKKKKDNNNNDVGTSAPAAAAGPNSAAQLPSASTSGITAMRPIDSTSNLEDSPPHNHNGLPQQQPQQPQSAPTFFDKLIIHPVDLRVSWFPDESLYSKPVTDAIDNQWVNYLVRYLAVEGARLSLSRISLSNVKMEDVTERLVVEAWPQLKASKLLLLLAGLQPVRPVAEITGAIGDLVLTPLEYWQHQRSVFVGIARGIQICTGRLAAESLTLTATGTRIGQHAALAATRGIQRNPAPLLWGNQPASASEGAVRALRSAEKGVLDFGAGVLFCVDEMKQSSTVGGLMRLPLSLLIPVEGMLRGATEALLGLRNTIRPEERVRDTQEFKSTVFSHKKGDSDDDDDNDAVLM